VSTTCNDHCWHTPTFTNTIACYPPREQHVCCHCGTVQYKEIPQPPIPEGHGPHYPRPFGNTVVYNWTA